MNEAGRVMPSTEETSSLSSCHQHQSCGCCLLLVVVVGCGDIAAITKHSTSTAPGDFDRH